MEQLFSLGTGRMEPIVEQGLERGDRVQQARSGKVGVVTGWGHGGYRVIFDDGQVCTAQRLDTLSPFTRVTKVAGTHTDADVEAMERMVVKAAEAARERDRIEKIRWDQQVELAVAELRQQWPNAKKDGSAHARVGANIRMELKAAFPGTKFSVRGQSYAGGNSVRVDWVGGPKYNDVKAITDKYEMGSFDGMQDLYEYDRSPASAAVGTVLGQVKYVFCRRELTEAEAIELRGEVGNGK